MTLFTTVDPRPIHFMGIAGAGMSGLALLAKEQGVTITGCDTDPSGAADLAAVGVEIWRGPDPEHVAGARALVVPAAVAVDHPELERARALGVPVVRRADALGQAVAGGLVVAVAGTHGKTTTTVMVTEALAAAGRNPTGLAGGRVARWGGDARLGGGGPFGVEADEEDRALLSPAAAGPGGDNLQVRPLAAFLRGAGARVDDRGRLRASPHGGAGDAGGGAPDVSAAPRGGGVPTAPVLPHRAARRSARPGAGERRRRGGGADLRGARAAAPGCHRGSGGAGGGARRSGDGGRAGPRGAGGLGGGAGAAGGRGVYPRGGGRHPGGDPAASATW